MSIYEKPDWLVLEHVIQNSHPVVFSYVAFINLFYDAAAASS